METLFQRASRKKAKLRLAICGPSGSGKTYSALLIAQGLGGRIALIDTERGSGELYASLCEYETASLVPPFSPDRYIQLIRGAENEGFDVIVVDSLSHAWSAEGGVLEMHDKAAAQERNSYTAWRHVTPQHNSLVDAILQSPCHIIATMRTKVAYEIVENDKGKKVPQKIGLAPIQREGMEYEFTCVLDLSVAQHVASSSKDRTGLFDGQFFVPSIETGQKLVGWLNSGEVPKQEAPPTTTATDKQVVAAYRAAWRSANSGESISANDLKPLLKQFGANVDADRVTRGAAPLAGAARFQAMLDILKAGRVDPTTATIFEEVTA